MNSPRHGGYVVLQQVGHDEWRMVGEADRRPGLPARKSRAQAVRDASGREPKEGEVFAVVPRSEWRNGLEGTHETLAWVSVLSLSERLV
jgi:hypothetical protein